LASGNKRTIDAAFFKLFSALWLSESP
jgi:hypothetical protein